MAAGGCALRSFSEGGLQVIALYLLAVGEDCVNENPVGVGYT
jgi:hypothetical protein